MNRDSVEIYYEVRGSGTPFFFFSETACAGDIWNTFQVPEFSRDHMVITHDYRGTGKSTKPIVQYSCEDFVDDAAAILARLNARPAILLGHSMGGRVAMLMALKYPEKVRKVIVASVGPGVANAPPIPLKMCKENGRVGLRTIRAPAYPRSRLDAGVCRKAQGPGGAFSEHSHG